MSDPVFFNVFEQFFLEGVGIVTVVQGSGPGEKVQVGFAVTIVHVTAFGFFEDGGKRPAIGTDFRFVFFKGIHAFILLDVFGFGIEKVRFERGSPVRDSLPRQTILKRKTAPQRTRRSSPGQEIETTFATSGWTGLPSLPHTKSQDALSGGVTP